MKLTKQKLKQLILQEMRYFRPPEFDPRAEKNYPEYASKLSDRYKDSPAQAASLAGSLDEPIDIEVPETDEEPEEFIPFGTRQFEQQSLITDTGKTVGLVEIFYNTQDKMWTVGVYRGTNPNGPFDFDGRRSNNFFEAKEAINYYNQLADNKYVYKST
jgi:hypothetical protein